MFSVPTKLKSIIDLKNKSNRKIIFGILANAIDKAWVTIFQIATLSVLPIHWGAAQFGLWLIITTIPTYVALGGLGFGNAAATDMTYKIGKSDYKGALEDFQTVWIFITAATVILAGASVSVWFAYESIFSGHGARFGKEEIACIILTVYSLLAIQTSLTHTGFRSTGNYAIGVILMDTISVAERIGVIAVAMMGKDYVFAALTMLAARIIGQIAFYYYLRLKQPWFKMGASHANRKTLNRLIKPALASLGLAASNALSLQGIITTLGIFVSPTSAALYSSVRTICRLPLQFSDLLGRATLPELTTAYSKMEMQRFSKLTALNTFVAIISVLPFIVFVSFFGKSLGNFLSRGGLSFTDTRLFIALATAALFQAIWSACGQSLQAINKHHFFSFPYFCLAAVTLLSPLLRFGGDTILAVAIISAVAEGITAAITVAYTFDQIKRARIPNCSAPLDITG